MHISEGSIGKCKILRYYMYCIPRSDYIQKLTWIQGNIDNICPNGVEILTKSLLLYANYFKTMNKTNVMIMFKGDDSDENDEIIPSKKCKAKKNSEKGMSPKISILLSDDEEENISWLVFLHCTVLTFFNLLLNFSTS